MTIATLHVTISASLNDPPPRLPTIDPSTLPFVREMAAVERVMNLSPSCEPATGEAVGAEGGTG